MHQLELTRELAARLQTLKNNLAPPAGLDPNNEKHDGDSEDLGAPILDIAELAKGKTDFSVNPSFQPLL